MGPRTFDVRNLRKEMVKIQCTCMIPLFIVPVPLEKLPENLTNQRYLPILTISNI